MKLARLGDGAEIFYTLQGEGVSVGAPAIFVRLSMCNLHCVWCDTDHTWNFEGTPWKHEKDTILGYKKHRKQEVILEMDTSDVAAEVRKFPCRRVVLTGGEPLLQEADLVSLMRDLRKDGKEWFFEIETNGTILPSKDFLAEISQLNVSSKLANTGIAAAQRYKPIFLAALYETQKAWFKFVVRDEKDLEEIAMCRSEAQIPAERVILMPEGRCVADLDRIAPWVAEKCLENGYRFSDRMHVRLWGDRRGV